MPMDMCIELFQYGCMDMCEGMRIDKFQTCVDIRVDVNGDMCIDTVEHVCMDLLRDMCIDMLEDAGIGVCTDMYVWTHLYRHV